jgi:hypothetical protein
MSAVQCCSSNLAIDMDKSEPTVYVWQVFLSVVYICHNPAHHPRPEPATASHLAQQSSPIAPFFFFIINYLIFVLYKILVLFIRPIPRFVSLQFSITQGGGLGV